MGQCIITSSGPNMTPTTTKWSDRKEKDHSIADRDDPGDKKADEDRGEHGSCWGGGSSRKMTYLVLRMHCQDCGGGGEGG